MTARPWDPRCAVCGKPILPQVGDRKPKYCGIPCRKVGQRKTHPWGAWRGKPDEKGGAKV